MKVSKRQKQRQVVAAREVSYINEIITEYKENNSDWKDKPCIEVQEFKSPIPEYIFNSINVVTISS